MKIVLDYQIFMLQAYGGISRYFVRLANELVAREQAIRVLAPLYCNRYLGELPSEHVIGRHIRRLPPKSFRVVSALNRHLCERSAKKFSPAIVHETYFSKSSVHTSGSARILTVYDMIHEKFPNSFSSIDRTSEKKRSAVDRADHIICISHSTKRDLCEIFDVPSEKVSVVHLGHESFSGPNVRPENSTGTKPFLLYVGQRGGYKNFEGFLRAIASDKELSNTFDIVAFGGGAFSASERNLIQTLKLPSGSVRHVQGDDAILGQLYRSADAFVYPSQYEGFGLPPLEAMANDCPVISSNVSSMPEVIGAAGEYFAPDDIDEQAEAIRKVVFDNLRRDELIEAGKERLKKFSWGRCAEETLEVYNKV